MMVKGWKAVEINTLCRAAAAIRQERDTEVLGTSLVSGCFPAAGFTSDDSSWVFATFLNLEITFLEFQGIGLRWWAVWSSWTEWRLFRQAQQAVKVTLSPNLEELLSCGVKEKLVCTGVGFASLLL